ncbi:MAG: substrate-binding domain-containing protein [Spirochaetales bacterium]|nr:substrate-binding domain-containing protein [Spirochaetales bacterium]
MKKKLVLLMIVLSVVISGVFAGGQQEGEREIVLGKIPYTLSHDYHQSHCKWVVDYAKEKYGVTVKVVDGEASPEKSLNAVESFVVQGVDGLLLHITDPVILDQAIEIAHEEDIPVVSFYNEPKTKANPHVRIDEPKTSFQMGVIAAKKWMSLYPDKPIKVGMISFMNMEHVLTLRSTPFFKGVKSVAPDAELVAQYNGEGSSELAMASAQDMIQAHPDVNIVYGSTAEHAIGALASFEAAGRGKAVDGEPLTEIIVGTDATEAELLNVFDPNSSFKITQGLAPKENAMAEVDALMQMINGELEPNEWSEISTYNIVLDYWNNSVDEGTSFIKEQYFSDTDLRKELGL